MLPGHKVNKPKDGGLRTSSGSGGGVGAVVGTSRTGLENVVQEFVDPDEVRAEYGRGELSDALCDALLNGASSVLGVRVSPGTQGSVVVGVKTPQTLITDVEPGTNAGTGSITVTGTPAENALVELEVLTDGASGVATFQWRKNGAAWTGPVTSGEAVALGATGLVASFVDGISEPSFVDGDTFSVRGISNSVGLITADSESNPFEDGDLEVDIITTGGINSGVFIARIGVAETEPMVIQAKVELEEFGVILNFAENSGGQWAFVNGDSTVLELTGEVADINDYMAALDILKSRLPAVHAIYIPSTRSDSIAWAMLETKAEEFRLANRWCFFIVDTKHPDGFDSVALWVADLLADAAETRGLRICVVPTRAVFTDYDDASMLAVRSIGGCLLGRLMSIQSNRSPGRFIDGPLVGPLRLYPHNAANECTVTEGQTTQLDTAGFTTGRNFEGQGRSVFVTDFHMFASADSDYLGGERRRVMDECCRGVYLAGQRATLSEASPAGLEALKTDLKETPRLMKAQRRIADFSVEIPPGQNVVATSTVLTKVGISPIGTMRWIFTDIGFTPGEVTE